MPLINNKEGTISVKYYIYQGMSTRISESTSKYWRGRGKGMDKKG